MNAEEIWKDIENYPGYQVSNIGRVRTLDRHVTNTMGITKLIRGKILKNYWHESYPYYAVNLYANRRVKHIDVHRLVGIAFVPNPKNLECLNHLDGNKTNNHYTNFEWCTRGDNLRHAHKIGLMVIGSKHGNAKLTETDIPVIRGLHQHLGVTASQIAPMYQVDRMNIVKIIRRKSWAHV